MPIDNSLSYQRFTSIDPNIAAHGSTAEEFKIQLGTPDPDPVLSPMPNLAVAEAQLSLGAAGSDRMRLGTPSEPIPNPYEGPKLTLVLSRNAVQKLRSRVLNDLQQMIDSGSVAQGNVRNLMLDSMRRVNGMREFMDHLNSMAESVMVHSLAASKG